MVYREEKRDLFEVSNDYYLAHCISADYALGAGIAVEFVKRFDMKARLREKKPNVWKQMKAQDIRGLCVVVGNVFNLVTKEKYWHKPTYESMEEALRSMRTACRYHGIKKIAMPVIGCGLDKLEWDKVSAIIKNVFQHDDVEILVCVR